MKQRSAFVTRTSGFESNSVPTRICGRGRVLAAARERLVVFDALRYDDRVLYSGYCPAGHRVFIFIIDSPLLITADTLLDVPHRPIPHNICSYQCLAYVREAPVTSSPIPAADKDSYHMSPALSYPAATRLHAVAGPVRSTPCVAAITSLTTSAARVTARLPLLCRFLDEPL